MDGKRVQSFFSNEIKALLDRYTQFETLLPNSTTAGASHYGEDGRYVEALLREYLRKYLPRELDIFSGFILRPAVKTGSATRERTEETDTHSTQIDIIVYDSHNYPIYERFNECVIVPPEGVIGVISVKKTLNDMDIENECRNLRKISFLCKARSYSGSLRGPYLALVSMKSNIEKQKIDTHDWIMERIESVYKEEYEDDLKFDDIVGLITSLSEWSIFKRKPTKEPNSASLILMKHKEDEKHLGFQFILTGLLSVYYDSTRNQNRRPGFTAFPSNREEDRVLGKIECHGLR
jgi:hypothetical protein